jgi:hypothetical protein
MVAHDRVVHGVNRREQRQLAEFSVSNVPVQHAMCCVVAKSLVVGKTNEQSVGGMHPLCKHSSNSSRTVPLRRLK